MNQPAHGSREEQEARLTALLLGELPEAEAVAVRRAMEQDAELAALHGRLKRAIELVREVAASPAQELTPPAIPQRMSADRRQRLLEQFKTVAPVEFREVRRRETPWYIPMGMAAALAVMIGLAATFVEFSGRQTKLLPASAFRGEGAIYRKRADAVAPLAGDRFEKALKEITTHAANGVVDSPALPQVQLATPSIQTAGNAVAQVDGVQSTPLGVSSRAPMLAAIVLPAEGDSAKQTDGEGINPRRGEMLATAKGALDSKTLNWGFYANDSTSLNLAEGQKASNGRDDLGTTTTARGFGEARSYGGAYFGGSGGGGGIGGGGGGAVGVPPVEITGLSGGKIGGGIAGVAQGIPRRELSGLAGGSNAKDGRLEPEKLGKERAAGGRSSDLADKAAFAVTGPQTALGFSPDGASLAGTVALEQNYYAAPPTVEGLASAGQQFGLPIASQKTGMDQNKVPILGDQPALGVFFEQPVASKPMNGPISELTAAVPAAPPMVDFGKSKSIADLNRIGGLGGNKPAGEPRAHAQAGSPTGESLVDLDDAAKKAEPSLPGLQPPSPSTAPLGIEDTSTTPVVTASSSAWADKDDDGFIDSFGHANLPKQDSRKLGVDSVQKESKSALNSVVPVNLPPAMAKDPQPQIVALQEQGRQFEEQPNLILDERTRPFDLVTRPLTNQLPSMSPTQMGEQRLERMDPQLATRYGLMPRRDRELAKGVEKLNEGEAKIDSLATTAPAKPAEPEIESRNSLSAAPQVATVSPQNVEPKTLTLSDEMNDLSRGRASESKPRMKAKSDLDTQGPIRQAIQLRLLQESAGAALPKSSSVTIVDRAEEQPAKDRPMLERLRGAVTGMVGRTARIEIAKDNSDIAPLLYGAQTQNSFDPYFIQTEFEKIKSKTVLNKVIDQLKLNEGRGEQFGRSGASNTDEAYQRLLKRIDVRQANNSGLIDIKVHDENPAEAARIANTIAEVYRDARDQARREAEQQTLRMLEAKANTAPAGQPAALPEAAKPAAPPSDKVLEDVNRPKPTPATPIPQPEVSTRENAFSTFSLNVSDVSFKLAAASLEKGILPDPGTIRSEEFINAFDYRDLEPPPGVPVGFAWDRTQYPFAQNRDLLRFSIKTAAEGRQAGQALNLVVVLDNSGSMERVDRVATVREALRVLAGQLQPQDKLSVVTFARTARLWSDGVPGDQAGAIVDQVSGVTPEGGTNLEEALRLAYETALKHYLPKGGNRLILLTDGAANLGNVNPDELRRTVQTHRQQGVALDCFGIGWEGLDDDLLESLSRNGDGRYGFINSPAEAASGFASQLAGALHVAASDVKVQVEFNPDRVTTYRQVGYAKHQLTKEQFRDNTVDAAELGAAESGNALYVVEVNPAGQGPLAGVRVRYKVPGTGEFHEREWTVPYMGNAVPVEQSSSAMRLATTAGAFAEWLGASPFATEVTLDRLLGYLGNVPAVYGADGRPKTLEWMIRNAKSLAGKG